MDLLGEELDSSNWVDGIRSCAASLRGLEVTGIVEPVRMTCQAAKATERKRQREDAEGRTRELQGLPKLAKRRSAFSTSPLAVSLFPCLLPSGFRTEGDRELGWRRERERGVRLRRSASGKCHRAEPGEC